MKTFSSLFAALVLLLSFSANSFALTMDQAKAQGLIGETSTGYLASVKANPSAEVKSVVATINQKRRAAYVSAAAKASVTLDVIEKRVAQRLFNKAASGAFLRNSAGAWYKK